MLLARRVVFLAISEQDFEKRRDLPFLLIQQRPVHSPPIPEQSPDDMQDDMPPISQQQGFDLEQATLITGLVDIKSDGTEGRNTTSIRFPSLFLHWLKSNSSAIPNWAVNKSADIAARTNRLILNFLSARQETGKTRGAAFPA